jgi:hypothetical protein
MIQKFDGQCTENDDFGYDLTAENVDEHFAGVRQRRNQYRELRTSDSIKNWQDALAPNK